MRPCRVEGRSHSLRCPGLCCSHGPRRKAKWKPPKPKVLATPESKRVVRCYATQGKAYTFHPTIAGACRIILVNEVRDVLFVTRDDRTSEPYCSNEVPLGDWFVLGRLPRNGELPHGELDDVDPELAEIEKLPRPNKEPYKSHSIRSNTQPTEAEKRWCTADVSTLPMETLELLSKPDTGMPVSDSTRAIKEHGENCYFVRTKDWATMEGSSRRQAAAKWLAIFLIPCALLWLAIRWMAQGFAASGRTGKAS